MTTAARLVCLCAFAAAAARAQPSSAPPPSAAAPRSAADLEKLVAPIALYPDSLIATILPASCYPLEIVQAARYVANTNNLARLDAQTWDASVKAVARIPAVIRKMDGELQWTIALGEAFLAQDKDVLDAVQRLRGAAREAGTLRTTPQQTVVVTNVVVERVVEQRVTVTTNTLVQIEPAVAEVVYVPIYDPAYVYYPPPGYVYNPAAPLVGFGVGVAIGAIIANDCDWHHGGVYVGHHGTVVWGGGSVHGDVDIDVDRNVNVDRDALPRERGEHPAPRSGSAGAGRKWQPDPSRLQASSTLGSTGAARRLEARGWSTSGDARPAATAGGVAARPATGGSPAARPSTGSVAARPSTGSLSSRPTATTSRTSAFGGVGSGASARAYSSRGSVSRSGGGFSRSGGGFSGGRGGGRR